MLAQLQCVRAALSNVTKQGSTIADQQTQIKIGTAGLESERHAGTEQADIAGSRE